MRTTALVLSAGLLAACATTPPPAPPPAPVARPMPTPPAAARGSVVDTLHGVAVADPYRALEDPKDPATAAWVKGQDEATRALLGRIEGRDAIAARLKELYYVDQLSAPIRRGENFFWSRRHADKEKSIVYWKHGKDGAEKPLLDPNGWSKDGTVSLGAWVPSWDGTKVAFQQKANNSDEATLYVLDVATGERSTVDVIEGGKYAQPSWTPKGDGFYYVRLPVDPSIPTDARPGYADLRFHKLGTDPKGDALVKEKTGDPTKFVGIELDRDGRFLFSFVMHGWTKTDVWFQDLKAKKPTWIPLAVGNPFLYTVQAHQGRFYVTTNDGAPMWRVFVVDPNRPERKAWKELVKERKDAALDGVTIVGGHLALTYMKSASNVLELVTLDGKPVRSIPMPGIGTVGGPVGLPEDDEAYFSFESFIVPRTIFSTSVKTGETKEWSKVSVNFDPTPYTVEQVFYPSRDGTQISMFLVHRKDAKPDGQNLTYLYGYGGFQISLTPTFNTGLFPWLERGGLYAVPNLRGGGEYGEDWHTAGMLERKQNVFDDFLAAAEWLQKNGWTKPSRMAIGGGSNGGLLVGAAMTQRPELFRAVVCSVPLLDMVRYHLFGSGRTWISEYGSAEDPAQFKALHAYSPYHHVKDGAEYPALLMDAADADDRVDPLHARKFLAAIQAADPDAEAWLRVEPNSGHGGADLVKQAVERGADRWAFVLWALGEARVAP